MASSLPSQPTTVLYHPTQVDMADEEVDVDLMPPERVNLEITDRAAEVCRQSLMSDDDLSLHLAIDENRRERK